jgi:hypothetical protein
MMNTMSNKFAGVSSEMFAKSEFIIHLALLDTTA